MTKSGRTSACSARTESREFCRRVNWTQMPPRLPGLCVTAPAMKIGGISETPSANMKTKRQARFGLGIN